MVPSELTLDQTVTCSSPESMRPWESHIRGVLISVGLRGEKQLKHDIGLQIFLVLRAQVVSFPHNIYIIRIVTYLTDIQLISCLQRKAAVPDIVIELSSKVLQYDRDVALPENTLTLLATRLCGVKGSGIYEHVRSIYSLFSIKDDLAKWAKNLPEAYEYTTVTTKASRQVLSGYYHVYQDDSLAEI
jgi:hypothetical protein